MILKNDNNDKGFSIVEIGVVFVIMSFVFLPIFALIVHQNKENSQERDVEGNDRAVAAINQFLKINGRYPCPADPADAYGDTTFGEEDCTITPYTAGPVSVMSGSLPFKSLNLPFHAGFNENDWHHIYTVTTDLVNATTFDAIGDIIIENEAGDIVTEEVHFMVVNPGKDGKGSNNLLGDAPDASVGGDCTSGALDDENCNGDHIFVEAEGRNEVNPTDSAFYDDALAFSHGLDKSGLWVMQKNTSAGRLEVSNRNLGNIGVGTANAPTSKFHVAGGDILVEYDTQGGQVKVQQELNVKNTITADAVASAGTVYANDFCFGQVAEDGSCCPSSSNLYTVYAETPPSSGIYVGTEQCGTGCAAPDDVEDIAGMCCTRFEYNKNTGLCS